MRTREFLHEVMSLAWQFVKRNGYTMSEAMKVAWANLKLKGEMKKKIVKFYFKKVDGSVREAYGTLNVVICFRISIFEPLKTTEYMLQANYQLVTHIFRN